MGIRTDVRILSRDDVAREASKWREPEGSGYYAMYSSVFGGILTDPSLMVIPLDDHMVHRGDGVFEAFKCVSGSIYNLGAHLDRLQLSASGISLELPGPIEWIKQVVVQTISAGGMRDCMVRLFISRGIGSFDCNPRRCKRSNLYVIALEPWHGHDRLWQEGVSALTVNIPVKPGLFARVKSCNYLQNVMVYMEANAGGADFGIVLDEDGNIAEGATENIALITANNELVYPPFERALRGTSLLRGVELARILVARGILSNVIQRTLAREHVHEAKEMLVFGTGPNVLPIVRYDGNAIGKGKPGPVFNELSRLFRADIESNEQVLTPVW